MLVTGCGPQEIEKYCLLLPGCNIVLDKVLEIFSLDIIEKYCLPLPGYNIVLDKVLNIYFIIIRYHR